MIQLYHGDCCEEMKKYKDNSVAMVITSPPYDNMKAYGGITWDFNMFISTAAELKRVLNKGGVIVWVVNDQTENGSESGNSFRQALHLKSIGLNLHDTMIWHKDFRVGMAPRYHQAFDYMFVFSKGRPAHVNLIKDRKNKTAGRFIHGTWKDEHGNRHRRQGHNKTVIKETGARTNVQYFSNPGIPHNNHPAVFPLSLVEMHLKTWCPPGGIVLDPFMGSGTTGVACKKLGFDFIGIEKNAEYIEIAKSRLGDKGFSTQTDNNDRRGK